MWPSDGYVWVHQDKNGSTALIKKGLKSVTHTLLELGAKAELTDPVPANSK